MTHFKKNISILVFAFITLLLTSCNNDSEIVAALSDSDVAEVIEAALQERAGGFITNVQDMTEQIVDAVESGALCDTIYTDTIQKNHQGALIQANYTSSFTYEFMCNIFDNVKTATFSMLTDTEFMTSRIDADGNGTFTGTIDGLALTSPNIMLDGSYILTNTHVLNFKEQETINGTLTLTLTGFEINKFNQNIQSGTGTFTFIGSTTEDSFSFNGSLVFNGNKTATLTLNGEDYQLDWN